MEGDLRVYRGGRDNGNQLRPKTISQLRPGVSSEIELRGISGRELGALQILQTRDVT